MKKITIRALSAFLLFAVILLGFSSPTHAAAPGPEDASGYIESIITKPFNEKDLAHKSLAQLFGGFIFEPFGNAPTEKYPPTVLANVLGYSNVVALILGVVIMVYVIMAGALNTAASGEMLGRSWSSVWLPLRTSLAFGLVMPASGTAGETFSVAQSLVIYLLIIGSNSGSWIWEKGVESMLTGSPIMGRQALYESNTFREYAKIIHCSAVTSSLLKERDGKDHKVVKAIWKDASVAQGNSSKRSKNITYEDFKSGAILNTIVSQGGSLDFDKCGKITIPNSSKAKSESYKGLYEQKKWDEAVEAKFDEAVSNNFPSLIKPITEYADYMVLNKMGSKAIAEAFNDNNQEVILKVIEASDKLGQVDKAYDTFITNITNETVPDDITDSWKKSATELGWMGAGAWFFQISKIQGFVQNKVASLNGLAKFEKSSGLTLFCLSKSCRERSELWNDMLISDSQVGKYYSQMSHSEGKSSSPSGASVGKMSLIEEEESGSFFSAETMTSVSEVLASGFLNSVMWLGEDDAAGTGGNAGSVSATSTTGMISPFTAVASIGRGFQQISVIIWTAGLVAAGYLGANDTVWGVIGGFASGSASGAFAGAVKYVLATMVPVMAGISSLGFMMAFAIPFMPITVWIMLVCGYLLMAIEAVAASPLAVIMLATPEGEGISGHNFQKALQMINAIILRPTLSIVGLFASISLAYVGFSIMNTLFWQVVSMATSGFSLFEIMAILFVYCSLAYKLCEYMVSVIYKIPDQIMEWMGGGLSRSFGEEAAEKGITSDLGRNNMSGGLAIGAGMGAVAGGSLSKEKKAAKAFFDEKEAREKDEK